LLDSAAPLKKTLVSTMPELEKPSIAALTRRLSEVRLLRFGLVGVSNTVIGFTVFRGALHLFAAFYSQALSYTVGMLWSYYWNRRWTFQSQSNVAREATRFFGLQIAFMLVSAALLGLLVDRFHFAAGLSWLGVVVVITALNFVASRYWAIKPAA
jgi:putative flippase GtrA